MLGRKIEEGEPLVLILDQALDRLVVCRTVFPGKDVERARSRRSVGSRPDPAQVMLHPMVDRLRLDSFADRVFKTFAALRTVHR